jgi:hypothetical protein
MNRLGVIVSIGTAILPIIGALIFLWSDVQTMKQTKVDYREIAELKIEITGQLSKNTEAIENLNRLISRLLDERKEWNGKEISSN